MTNFSEQNHQQLGSLQADVKNVKDDIAEIQSDVREMRDILNKVQGSWKTLVILSGISATVGIAFTKVISFLPSLFK